MIKKNVFHSLTALSQAAMGSETQNPSDMEEGKQKESCPPFDKLATKLGLPRNCDIDLRKQEELEVTGVLAFIIFFLLNL